MKVLFVSRAKGAGISPIVESQGKSLIRNGINLIYYRVEKSGLYGYLTEVLRLRKYLKQNSYDVIHAHYSWIALLATLSAFPKRIVVSLMGSDTKTSILHASFIKLLCRFIWAHTIVKSKTMSIGLPAGKVSIIPNGVDFEFFKPMDKLEAQKSIGFDHRKRHVVFFLSHPNRKEKNVELANLAMSSIDPEKVEFHIVSYIEPTQIPKYLCAADLLLLTSFHEGSPNIIKEAMACCTPIVSTNVGDVEDTLGRTEGCYICSYDVKDVREKINQALAFNGRTNGRNNIARLDAGVIANRIIDLYRRVI